MIVLINVYKSIGGPRIEPRGTPEQTGSHSEKLPLKQLFDSD